jgi:hypothetical protein
MKPTKSQRLVRKAFHEVHHNAPNVVSATIAKKGLEQGNKQRVAIALSKARAKGARGIPKGR